MPMSEKRAKELAELEPPRSIERIVRFTDELGERLRSRGTGEAGAAPGSLAQSAFGFSGQIAEHNVLLVGGLSAGEFRSLVSRHAVVGNEIQDFARWLNRWNEKRTAIEAIQAPEFVFSKPSEAADGIEGGVPTISQLARKRVERIVIEPELVEEVVEVRPKRTRKFREIEEREETTWSEATKPFYRPERPAPRATPRRIEEAPESKAPEPAAPEPSVARRVVGGLGRTVWAANLPLGGFALGTLVGSQTATAFGATAEPSATLAAMRFADPTISGSLRGPYGGLTPVGPGGPFVQPEMSGGMLAPAGGGFLESAASMVIGAVPPPTTGFTMIAPGAGHQAAGMAGELPSRPGGVVVGMLPGGTAIYLPQAVAAALRAQYGRPPFIPRPAVSPLMGQVTIVAPQLQVASEDMRRGGSALAMDWKKLGLGAGPLDAAGWKELQAALPPGAQVIYPALPPGSLGPGAANFRLAQPLLGDLMAQAYGPGASSLAGPAAFAAAGASMTSPTVVPLVANIVPTTRPMGETLGVLGERAAGAGALGVAGQAQAQRTDAMEFLGMPVRLAPSLGGRPELRQELAARRDPADLGKPKAIKPQEFAPLRRRMLSRFQTVEAEPDVRAWQSAAPTYGLRGAKPSDILAPDARVKPPKVSEPLPQIEGGASPIAQEARRLERQASRVARGVEHRPLSVGGTPVVPTPAATVSPKSPTARALPAVQRPEGTPPYTGAPPAVSSLPSLGAAPTPTIAGPSLGAGAFSTISAPGALAATAPAIGMAAQSATSTPLSYGHAPAFRTAGPPSSLPAAPGAPSLSSVSGRGTVRLPSVPSAATGRRPSTPSRGPSTGSSLPALPGIPMASSGAPEATPGAAPRFPSPLAPTRAPAPLFPGVPPPPEPATHPEAAPSPPPLSLPELGGQSLPLVGSSSSRVSPPPRLFPNLSALPGVNAQAQPMLQRATDAPRSTGGTHAQGSSPSRQDASPAQGSESANVDLLANQVLMILRHRLKEEAIRQGRR